jgi:hypoxanthine phosphoribosyltransferase
LVVVPVLNGTVMFVADLLRHLTLPVRLDFVGMSSYRDATSPGALRVTKDLGLDVRGRDLLLVDDILDSGQTLHHVVARLRRLHPRRLRICVLLEKQVPRNRRIRPHYTGFRIPDCFVVGYGLDYAERYRNLPFIGILKAPEG